MLEILYNLSSEKKGNRVRAVLFFSLNMEVKHHSICITFFILKNTKCIDEKKLWQKCQSLFPIIRTIYQMRVRRLLHNVLSSFLQ